MKKLLDFPIKKMINYLFLFSISFLLSIFLLKILTPFLTKYLIDKPNNRSSHLTPKPRGGGIVFVITSILGSIYFLFRYGYSINYTLAFFCIPLAFIGLADDI